MILYTWGKCIKLCFFSHFFFDFSDFRIYALIISMHMISQDTCQEAIFFGTISHHSLKILLKWSKTLQSRDKIKIITLPSLGQGTICPLRAIEKLYKLYNPIKMNLCFNSGILQDNRFLSTLKSGKPYLFSIQSESIPLTILRSTPLEGQEPHWFLPPMFLFFIFNYWEHGHLTVFGITYIRVQIMEINWYILFPNYTAYKCCLDGF